MNKIYNFKINFIAVLSFICFFTPAFLSAGAKTEPAVPYSFTANSAVHTISWNKIDNAVVVVFVSVNNREIVPDNFSSDDISNSGYRKGFELNGAYVAYKGNGNSVELTELQIGRKYFVNIFEVNAVGTLKNITNKVITDAVSVENGTQKIKPQVIAAATPVVCPTLSGITCTLNGTTGSGYIAGTAPCNTAGFAGTNPWDGGGCTGFISFSFSTPIKVATIKMIAVNLGGERTTVTSTGGTGGALTVSGLSCMSALGTVLGPYTGGGSFGDVAATITSAGTYTTITCTNTGCNSGWVASCPTFLSVLPIELVSFTGECSIENVVDLKWKTISETNNDYFTIERSSNTSDWTAVGRIKGAGNSIQINEYVFTDKQRFNETMYYRIKQTDFNNEFEYSDVVAVHNCKVGSEFLETISVYPNPAQSNISIRTDIAGVTLEIFNALGIQVGTYILQSGENKLELDALDNGTYYTKLSDNDHHFKMSKLIISR